MKAVLNEKATFNVPSGMNENGKQAFHVIEKKYSDLIIDACNRASDPQKGFTYDDMEKIDRVKKAVAGEKEGVISLEDADYAFVKQRVDTMVWAFNDMEFVNFRNKIREAGK